MARKSRAPQHRLDHTPKFIVAGDEAWDKEVVRKALTGPGMTHNGVDLDPLRSYLMGFTRFDLEAPDLREVIEKTQCLDKAKAEIWELRILTFEVRRTVLELEKDESTRYLAHHMAFAHGVMKLSTPATDDGARELAEVIAALPTERHDVHIRNLNKAVAAYAYEALDEVGWACKMLSRDVSEEEQKN